MIFGQMLNYFPAIIRCIRDEVRWLYWLLYFQKVFPQQLRESWKRVNASRDRVVLIGFALSVLNETVVFEVVNDGLHRAIAWT